MWRRPLNSVFDYPYPQKIKKAVRGEAETQVPSRMVDKWTVGSNKEGLYNGVKPPEERDQERKRKNIKEELL